MELILKNQRGQTVIEYLLLTLMAALTAYIFAAKTPLVSYTRKMLIDIQVALQGTVRNGTLDTKVQGPETQGHPSNPERLRAVH